MSAPGSIILSILLIIAFFLIKHLIIRYLTAKNDYSPDSFAFSLIKLAGILLFGIIPLATLNNTETDMSDFGLSSGDSASYWYLFILIPLLIIGLQIFLPTKKEVLSIYPDLNPGKWSAGYIMLLMAGWFLYTAAYEILFRGLLFFSCYREFGLATGIIINIALYSLAHIPKGMLETLGAIPFGILLCLVSYFSGSVYLAIVVHCSLSLSTQLITLHRRGLFNLFFMKNSQEAS
jgi:membrane protease YdiL (CAAX protease family)